MFFKKKVYPILPTSESDTMTFIQKLDYLEYRVNQLNEKIIAAESAISDLETAVEEKSTVSATASGSTLQTLTVDGTTYDVPQGTEVSATDDEGVLQTLTIGSDTYTVPQGGEAGEIGTFIFGTNSWGQWRYVNDILVLQFVLAHTDDGIDSTGAGIRFSDSDGNWWTKLDGKTLKSSISWVHDFGSSTYAAATANLQIAIFSDGLGSLSMPGGYCIPTGLTPFSANDTLQDINGRPFMFLNAGLI